jgi:hypothetical protein
VTSKKDQTDLSQELTRLSRAKFWIWLLFTLAAAGAVFTFALGIRYPVLLHLLSIESSNVQREVTTAAQPNDARVSAGKLIADLRTRLQKRDWFDGGFQMGLNATATGLAELPQAEAKLVTEPLKRLQDLAPKLAGIAKSAPEALSQIDALVGTGRVLEPARVPSYSPFLDASKAMVQLRPHLMAMKTAKTVDKPDAFRAALKAVVAGRQRIDHEQFKSAMSPRRVGIRNQTDQLIVLKRANEWESAIFSANAVGEEVLARLVGLESAIANQQAVHLRTSDKTNQFDLWTLTFLSGFVAMLAFVAASVLLLTADRELRALLEEDRLVPSGPSGDAVIEPALSTKVELGSSVEISIAASTVADQDSQAGQTLRLAGEQVTYVLLAAKQIGDLGRQLSDAIRKLSEGLAEVRQATETSGPTDLAAVMEPARLRLQDALGSLVSLKEQGLQLSVMASNPDAPRGMSDLCDRFSENIDYIELQARKLEKTLADQQQLFQDQPADQPPAWSRLQTDAEAMLMVTRQWVSQIGRLNEALAELSATLEARAE